MRIEGRAYRGNYLWRVLVAEDKNEDLRFSKRLEQCLVDICHGLEVAPPLWMQKNTHEFAAFHQTIFHAEQFMEDVPFSRLQIKWLDDGREL